MDEISPIEPPRTSKFPKWLTTITPFSKALAISMFIIFPIVGFYLGYKFQKSSVPEVVNRDGAVKQNLEDTVLLNDIRSNISNLIVSEGLTKYAVYLIRPKDIPDYQPFGQNSGLLTITDNLIILNLQTGEREVIESQKLIPQQMIEFLKNLPSDKGAHFRLYTELLRWSPFTENVFWGKTSIYSNGDPPIANEVGFFKYDIPNSKIDSFTLPNHGLFGEINENTNAQKVLYESLGEGLSLYLHDLKSKEDKLIISYDKNTFNKYCKSEIEYVYKDTSFYGTCGRDRGLRAQWENDGVSYFDFVTGKRVNLDLKQ